MRNWMKVVMVIGMLGMTMPAQAASISQAQWTTMITNAMNQVEQIVQTALNQAVAMLNGLTLPSWMTHNHGGSSGGSSSSSS